MSTQDTAIVPQPTLEERITARLHESIGELITDADLKGIVSRGIEQALFQPRKVVERSSYSGDYRNTVTLPPLVDELVAKFLTLEMTKAVEQWLKDNPALLAEALQHAVNAGAGAAMLRALDYRFASLFDSGIQSLQAQGLLPRTSG